jgi:hypothetical protein
MADITQVLKPLTSSVLAEVLYTRLEFETLPHSGHNWDALPDQWAEMWEDNAVKVLDALVNMGILG